MDAIIQIKDLNFEYKDKKVFSNFSLNIKKGTFTTIIGPNGSGKTTLAKLISGMINPKAYVKIDDMFVNSKNIKRIRKTVGLALSNPDNQFVCDTVKEDMIFALKNYNYSKEKIKEKITDVTELLDISYLLDIDPHHLSGGEKQLVSTAIALAHDAKIIVLDEALSMVDSVKRNKVLNSLNTLSKKGITIINITNDSEDLLKGSDVIIMSEGNIILQEKLKNSFKNVNLFTDNNIALPFIVDLSIKLQYYKVIDRIYYDNKKLVDALWK